MLTRRVFWILGLSFLFPVLAILTQSWSFAVLVVPIATMFLFSAITQLPENLSLEIRRLMDPPRTMGMEDVTVTVEIRNTSNTRFRFIRVVDTIPASMKLADGTNLVVASLDAGEQLSFSYRIEKPPRGQYRFGPVVCRWEDAFGLRAQTETIDSINTFVSLPPVEPIGTADIRPRRVGAWPGTVPSRRSGRGTEFYGLRQYTPGDDLKRINWKASARSRQLVTNEFEGELVTDIGLILDASTPSSERLFGFDFLEYSVQLAASLAALLLKQGNRVGLLVYGAYRVWVPPGFGKRQMMRVLIQLAGAEAGPSTLPIENVVEALRPYMLPVRSQVIVISALMESAISEVIESLGESGYSVLTITPRLDLGRSSEHGESVDLALRILRLERENILTHARRYSSVVEVNPQASLRAALRRIRRWRPPITVKA